MAFIDAIKEALPDYAKDTKLNLDAVLLRSTLDADVAMGCAVAALAATGNGKGTCCDVGRCSCSRRLSNDSCKYYGTKQCMVSIC
jgi:hypothetical protein